jgi:hypothetical protein
LKFTIYITLFFASLSSFAQQALVTGKVYGENNEAIPYAKIFHIDGTQKKAALSDSEGKYRLQVPAEKEITIYFESYFFKSKTFTLTLNANETKELNVQLISLAVEKIEKRDEINILELPVLNAKIPSPTGNFEDLLKTQAGVSSSSELSSGYSVRGGNFDENLVYVNDIEVYRPFLARAGQQEGLSFINSDLVEQVKFSAGGFDAKYGDKLSSVLDITYKRPHEFGGSFSGSFLGGTAHIEGISKNSRFTYLTGMRYRNNAYLLNGLGTKGEYRPIFIDVQSYFTYNVTDTWEISFLGSFAKNSFTMVPETRETNFGPINQTLKLRVFFDGQEISEYETYFGAITSTHRPYKNTEIKFINSIFRTFEEERFDIQGQYFLDAVENDPSSEDYGESAFNLGVGTFLNHARNRLDALVYNSSVKARHKPNPTTEWLYGVSGQYESINDKLREWEMLDSSGYLLPRLPDSVGYVNAAAQPYQTIELNRVFASTNSVQSSRISGYVQYNKRVLNEKLITFKDSTFESIRRIEYSLGLRSNYWTFNNQNVVSPRASITVKPRWYYLKDSTITRKDFNYRFSTGFYYQPPFYREFRGFNGDLNPEIRAQKSIHFVLGADYIFEMWGRPFKYTAEVYYKHLLDIIPFEIDNVRIRYYATNNAKGYAAGVDQKIFGEFIEGIDSWFTLSFMKTEEDILDDFYREYYNAEGEQIYPGFTNNFKNVVADSTTIFPGYIPRPTDQRINFGIFFQDHMPKHWNTEKVNWETFKVYLALQFGTPLPFGPPTQQRYQDVFRTPSYRRVDIGFSKELLVNRERLSEQSFWHNVKGMSVTLEVFNLLDVNNTSNYTWIKDASNLYYAVPNHLTARRLNLKLMVNF